MSRKSKIVPKSPDAVSASASRLHTPASVSFRYVEKGGSFCPSRCTQDEVREIVDCLRQFTTMSWQQVLNSGGKGGRKAGLGYTVYADGVLRGVARPEAMRYAGSIFGIRASQKMRIFAIYDDHLVYLLWFDRNHEIVPVR